MQFNIQFNIGKKTAANRQAFRDGEEIPDSIRQAYEKAMASPASAGNTISAQTLIIFNGKKYRTVDEMPADIRPLYEMAMTAVKEGKTGGAVLPDRPVEDNRQARLYGLEKRPAPSTSSGLMWINIGFAILVVLALLFVYARPYFLH